MANKVFVNFSKNKEVSEIVKKWWSDLSDSKGDRANLRRCSNTTEVMFIPAYHKLRRELRALGEVNDRALACMAGILAHVKNDSPEQSIANLMSARKEQGETPRVSELRFRRLIQSESHEDIFGPTIRIVRMLDGSVGIAGLAKDLYEWGDRTKKQWAFDYYSNIPSTNSKSERD